MYLFFITYASNKKHPMIIGREKEQAILQEALESTETEMIELIWRRRVGKIFLVNKTYIIIIAWA